MGSGQTREKVIAGASDCTGQLPAWTENAVLVYGPRKGGTTLFQNLLDGSDGLFAYPAELKLKFFISHDFGSQRNDDAKRYRSWSRIRSVSSARLSQDTYTKLWNSADPALSLKDLIRQDVSIVFESVTPRPPTPKLWCAKDVGGKTDRILKLWFDTFPESRVLFILRDPLMVTRAILNDRRRRGVRLKIRRIAREMLDAFRVVKAQTNYLEDPRILAIAYEDLVVDTRAVMRRVADFLRLPYSEHFERPSILGDAVVVSTSSRKTKNVFAEGAKWSHGLTLRERAVVTVVRVLTSLMPSYGLDYPAIRQRLGTLSRDQNDRVVRNGRKSSMANRDDPTNL
jgi:hypothetical protein